MGLPGSGKTTLARRLESSLKCEGRSVTWLNADKIRSLYQDWDFSYEGRIRQAKRLTSLANVSDDDYVIVDFIAPLQESRDIFNANFTIWMDTLIMSKYEDTDNIFEAPVKYNLRIQNHDYSVQSIINSI
jgi:adenylylsulfate kinase